MKSWIYKLRAIAYNTAQRLVAIAANASTIDGTDADGWFQIAPYGTSKFHDGKRWLDQCFEKSDAQTMVTAFNGWLAKVARLGSGLPVFEGHPDVRPDLYPTGRRLGKIVELEARDDGLWGKPAWNALGEENKAQGYWVFPSPTWYYPILERGQSSFHPVELKSVGLTNAPNIRDASPMAANAEGDETNLEEDNTMKLTPEQMALLGLTEEGREYTAEEIGAAIEAIAAKLAGSESAMTDAENAKAAAEAEKTTAETAKATAEEEKTAACNAKVAAESERDTAVAKAANAILDAGVTAGIMSKAEADALRDAPSVEIASNAITAKAGTKALPHGVIEIGQRRVAINDAAARQATIAEAVAENEAKGMTYDAAWNAVKKDPAFAPLFDAMQAPGKSE
jgi:hypothetical protein